MRDVFDYTSPLGLLGRMADILVLERYIERLLHTRAEIIRAEAQAGEGARFSTPDASVSP
jgi:hypothetical protein